MIQRFGSSGLRDNPSRLGRSLDYDYRFGIKGKQVKSASVGGRSGTVERDLRQTFDNTLFPQFVDEMLETLLMGMAHSAELHTKFAISGPTHDCLLNLDRVRLTWREKLQP